MKKLIILTLIFVGILILTVWGWNSSKNPKSTSSLSTKAETMAPALELAVGTLRLEGTNEAIDKKTAAQLLPYWQLLDELNASESTASQETTSVLEKIKDIMTSDQVNAIENMKLTESDASTVNQGTGSAESSGTTPSNISNIAQVSTGGGPPGGEPTGGGMFTTGGGGSSSNGLQTSSSIETTTSLIEEVIKLLESKVK
jgi:hypothetical protein